MSKRGLEQNSQLYELDGPEALGSYLRIQPCSDDAPELSKCSIQWYRVSSQGGKKELISGIYIYVFYTCSDFSEQGHDNYWLGVTCIGWCHIILILLLFTSFGVVCELMRVCLFDK